MKDKQYKSLLINYFFCVFLIIYAFIMFNGARKLPLIVTMSFIMNFVFVVIALLKAKLSVSTYKINYYFILIFLILAPLNQQISGYAPWDKILTVEETVFTNFLILLYQFFFFISYTINSKSKTLNKEKITVTNIKLTKKSVNILTLSSLFMMLLGIYLFGFENLFVKGNLWDDDSSSIYFLLEFLIRSTPVISLAILLLAKKKKATSNVGHITSHIAFLFLATFLLNFPVALSRYMSGTVYLGLVIIILSKKFWRKKQFDTLIIFAITVVFPFFTLFKRNDLGTSLSMLDSFTFGDFNNVDFDAFTVLGLTVRYVRDVGLLLGEQIKGSLLFFIPRSIIDVKGIPSGTIVAEHQNFHYTNISEPIMGEGYIDFGIIGVLIYGVILGFLACKLDYLENFTSEKEGTVSFIEIVFPFSLGFMVFLLRGALQPVIVRIMGFYLFLFIIFVFQKFKIKKNQNSL